MKHVLFLDFDDSFTHNLVQELKRPGVAVEVRHWESFDARADHDLLVLGPGPGHPDDYEAIFAPIRRWLADGRGLFGVCLGHQLFWRLRGARIEKSSRPLHGQRIDLQLAPEWGTYLALPASVPVQRYNSFCVKGAAAESGELLHFQAEELLLSAGPRHITYQFHPESVGTKCRERFFRPVFRHLV